MKWWWIPLDKLLYSLSISDTTQCIVLEKQLWLLLGPGLTKCVNDMKGRWIKHNTDWSSNIEQISLLCTYEISFSYLLQITADKSQKIPPNKSADYKRIAVRNCICSWIHQHLGDDDLIIIKMITIIDTILMKCLGRSPPLVHCLFDGKYNSVLERRPISFQPPATNKPWENIKKWYKFLNQTSSPLEDVNVVQACEYLASRRSGRESR